MGFAERQFLQHGVRSLSVGHIQDEDDTRPVSQRIPLVDLAIEIELCGLANLGHLSKEKNVRFESKADIQ